LRSQMQHGIWSERIDCRKHSRRIAQIHFATVIGQRKAAVTRAIVLADKALTPGDQCFR
jgi:hypothetical protein